MTQSWFERKTIKIRDDGEEADAGAVDKKTGLLLIDKVTGLPIRVPTEARAAWPDGTYVHIKSTLKSGDYDLAQRLQIDPKFSMDMANAERSRMDADVKVIFTPIIWAAIFVMSFEGEAFHDPETGRPMMMPDDIEGRLAIARELPLQVVSFINTRITELASDPLPGVKTEKGSDGESGPVLTQISGGSTKKRLATG